PGGLRRLQLLPIPRPGRLAAALRRDTRFVALRLQGPRGDHRRCLAQPRPVRPPGWPGQRVVPRRRAVRPRVRPGAGPVSRPGRTYRQAATRFEPYRAAQEPDPPTRDALRRIVADSRRAGKPAFVFVNNRLEGNAPSTIEAVAERLGS